MSKKFFFIFSFFALTLIPFSIKAATSQINYYPSRGFYIDAGGGYVFAEAEDLFGNTVEANGASAMADVGYQFNRYLAAELNYIYLNNLSNNNSINWGIIALKGIAPLTDRFNLFAKAGWAILLDRGSNQAIFLGVGAAYYLTPRFDLHVQVSGLLEGFANFGIVSAGLSYHFSA